MISLTRLNHTPLVINSDLIEHIEVTPDTVLVLTNGQRFMVQETPAEVIDHVVNFRRSLLRDLTPVTAMPSRPNPEAVLSSSCGR